MNYFIGPLEESEANTELITPARLAQELQIAWRNVQFETAVIPNDVFSLRWSFHIDQDVSIGSLHNGGEVISLDSNPESVAKFAVWYRAIIPAQHQLCIFDDSSDDVIELRSENTEQEILDALYSV